ncbi:divalent-cation tolerance protein CutA [Pelagibius sp. Alg239-R121]|uniref:divalent-cation tolerance protein CutA n=1 Tax=Pelagibius sp. Alg239-R121 TaxID=2993448 RepID=UPI0024A6257A|nr:divalent-cation tolerance protein CutA [Pelagibius sp. Alg239-R121]
MAVEDSADSRPVLVLITVPDREVAGNIATALVEKRFAAAVHVAEIASVYRWQDAVHQGGEVVLTVKTVAARFADIEGLIDESHPYDLPPVIQIDIERTKSGYAQWIVENVSGNS